MIKEAIETLVSGRSLSFEQAAGVMEEIMGGEATPAQFGALVTALRIKGETVEEVQMPMIITPRTAVRGFKGMPMRYISSEDQAITAPTGTMVNNARLRRR